MDKCEFVRSATTPRRVIMFQPVMDDNDNTVDQIKERVKGIEIDTLVITNLLVGTLPLRNVDNTYTKQYEILADHNRVPTKSRIDY